MRMLFGMLVAVCATAPATTSAQDIVDVAAGNANFTTLVEAVKAAGLVETLKGPGPFTVFAPTNEAFANLPAGTLENLLKPENKDQLTAILTYHVVPGKVLAADVVKLNGQSVKTVGGPLLPIRYNGETVRVGDATVVQTDIEATNGVIHVIDSVLLPPPANPAPTTPAAAAPASPATVYDVAPYHHGTPAVTYAAPAPVVYSSYIVTPATPSYYGHHAAPTRVFYVMPSYGYGHHRGSSCGR